MSQSVDRPGHFRGIITEYGIREEQSGAIAIGIKVNLTEMWDGEQWQPWEQYDQEAEGFVYIVDKKSQVLAKNVESFVKFAGWDSTFESIEMHTWQPTLMGVTVTEEEYKQKKSLRASFVNAFEWTPGARSNITPARAKELATRFGSQLRAVAGNANRGAPPSGRPAAPPPPPTNQHNPPSIHAWTMDQAILECQNAGITREQLAEAIKAKGFTGWNMMRDTPTAKALIEGVMAPAPGSDGDIPF